ncbi:MAG TPA: hypothetical protein PKD64_17735 [Pirellulaceae bacterium]|nr:hypothetical protein [Pirellulaceae bacterium]HMO94030.1 hypothetical protein [Pirellulaceae bacterium]HMP70791.1 hypothetical protein [Pirellulaceae bacterium]
MAKAFGGTVVHDLNRAEIGTLEVQLTAAGLNDPVFGPLGDRFYVPIGHEDTVTSLPENCTLIGRTELAFQILRFDDAPIYGTQFHPELTLESYLARVRRYPKYVKKIIGLSYEEFAATCHDTPQMRSILPGFVNWALEGKSTWIKQ